MLRRHEPGSPAPFRLYGHLIRGQYRDGAPHRYWRAACASPGGPVEGRPSAAIGRGARAGRARQHDRRYARKCRVRPRVCPRLAALDLGSCHAPAARHLHRRANRSRGAGDSGGFAVRSVRQPSRRGDLLSSAQRRPIRVRLRTSHPPRWSRARPIPSPQRARLANRRPNCIFTSRIRIARLNPVFRAYAITWKPLLFQQ